MKQTRQFVIHRQFVLFALLACALSWWSMPLADGAILPHGPALAAVAVVGLVAGRTGLADLWGQLTRWRVSWTWYAIAVGIIAAIAAGAFALNRLLGASIASAGHLQPPDLAMTLALLLLLGGQWEEPGWSGYALPYGREQFGRRAALGLPLAALVAMAPRLVWHLPLLLAGTIPWYDAILYGSGFQLLIAWLYDRTGGSLPVIMLFHLASNVFLGGVFLPLFAGDDLARYRWLQIGLTWLAVLVAYRLAPAMAGLTRRGERVAV